MVNYVVKMRLERNFNTRKLSQYAGMVGSSYLIKH
jgi:hypothetical protein